MNLKDLFYLNRSDRSVLLFFLALAVAAVAVIALSDGAETVSALSNADSAKTSHHQPFYSANARSPYYEVDTRTTELFNFDPNTADSTTLLRLGLQPWQVRNIYKYRAAGGVYRRPLDFARLYGLTRKQYLALEPYISPSYAQLLILFTMSSISFQQAKVSTLIRPTLPFCSVCPE